MMGFGKGSNHGAPEKDPNTPSQEHPMTLHTRHDPYSAVHKGIRAAHMRCLVAIGSADPTRDAEILRLSRRIAEHLTMCNTHLQDENDFLHTALEARRPGASAHAAEDHDDHLHSFKEMNALLARLVVVAPQDRAAVLADLYRRFARFVADDLMHMDHEEHVLLPDLQDAFNDTELQELEGRIVTSIAPEHMVLFLEAMLDALPKAESAAILSAMQAGMPPSAYSALMAGVDARRADREHHVAAA